MRCAVSFWDAGSSLEVLEFAFSAVLFVSFVGATIAIIGLILQKFFARQVPPRLMYCFWMLVVFRFVFFFAPSSPTSFLNLFSGAEERPTYSMFHEQIAVHEGKASVHSVPTELISLDARFSPAVEVSRVDYSQIAWATLQFAWLTGLLACVFVLVIQAVSIVRLVKSSSTLDSKRLAQIFCAARDAANVNAPVRLRVTDRINVPSLVGLFRPTILLPKWCEAELSNEQLKLILTHELIHVRRRDALAQLLAHFVTILHWFNPLVRCAVRQVAAFRELSCDQQVIDSLARSQNKNESESLDHVVRLYGETILQIATRFSNEICSDDSRLTNTARTEWIPGFIGCRQKLVIERIKMLRQPQQNSRLVILSGIVCTALLIVVGFTVAQKSQPHEQRSQSEKSSATNAEFEERNSSEKRQQAEASDIDLNSLRMALPETYLADAGDVFGVFIEGVLGGEDGEAPPVQLPEAGETAPSIGFPVPVRSDGTISLPSVEPIAVQGRSLDEVKELVKRAYLDGPSPVIDDGRIIVTLMRARTIRVLVVREDLPSEYPRGFVLELPVYKNDVFNALMKTGGMPTTNANNVLQIARGTDSQLATQLNSFYQVNPDTEFPANMISASHKKMEKLNLNREPHMPRDQVELNQNDVLYVSSVDKKP